jgi:hypothetical protein
MASRRITHIERLGELHLPSDSSDAFLGPDHGPGSVLNQTASNLQLLFLERPKPRATAMISFFLLEVQLADRQATFLQSSLLLDSEDQHFDARHENSLSKSCNWFSIDEILVAFHDLRRMENKATVKPERLLESSTERFWMGGCSLTSMV